MHYERLFGDLTEMNRILGVGVVFFMRDIYDFIFLRILWEAS